MKVHQAKLKILQDVKQKQKDAETQRRIQRSIITAGVRVKKMQKREELVQKVRALALDRVIAAVSADQKSYEQLLKKLLIQGMIKLNESRLEVQCREIDVRTVQRVLEPAAREYEKMILEACGETIKVEATLSNKMLPGPSIGDGTPSCAGGLKISAREGKIVCDNTLDSRLEIAFADLMPVIRSLLFKTAV
jgi:V-type H+-transporting ATPase subunit E